MRWNVELNASAGLHWNRCGEIGRVWIDHVNRPGVRQLPGLPASFDLVAAGLGAGTTASTPSFSLSPSKSKILVVFTPKAMLAGSLPPSSLYCAIDVSGTCLLQCVVGRGRKADRFGLRLLLPTLHRIGVLGFPWPWTQVSFGKRFCKRCGCFF